MIRLEIKFETYSSIHFIYDANNIMCGHKQVLHNFTQLMQKNANNLRFISTIYEKYQNVIRKRSLIR